jgi:hypothetical protein
VTDGHEGTAGDRPAIPYLPFDTFRNFVDSLSGGRPLPPRIDRSLMAGMAGGTQTLLLGTLSTFGLIGDNREVLPPFTELVRAEADQRQQIMARLLQDTYPGPMALARQHATADQLAESFRVLSGYQGSTLRKAITFFLNMAKYAQVELSPFFRAPAQNPAGRKPATRRARGTTDTMDPSAAVGSTPIGSVSPVESRSIELGSGGTITVSCSVSFLSLSRSDREFVFDIVDRLDAYRDTHPKPPGESGSIPSPTTKHSATPLAPLPEPPEKARAS